MLSKEDGRSVNVAGEGTARTSWTMAVKRKVLVATMAADTREGHANLEGNCSYTPSEATYAEEGGLAVSYLVRKKLPLSNQTISRSEIPMVEGGAQDWARA